MEILIIGIEHRAFLRSAFPNSSDWLNSISRTRSSVRSFPPIMNFKYSIEQIKMKKSWTFFCVFLLRRFSTIYEASFKKHINDDHVMLIWTYHILPSSCIEEKREKYVKEDETTWYAFLSDVVLAWTSVTACAHTYI